MRELKLPNSGTTEEIKNESFVGVEWGGDAPEKCIIIETKSEEYGRSFVCMNKSLDISSAWSVGSKRAYAEKVLNIADFNKIFIFDSFKELTDWWSD